MVLLLEESTFFVKYGAAFGIQVYGYLWVFLWVLERLGGNEYPANNTSRFAKRHQLMSAKSFGGYRIRGRGSQHLKGV